MHALNTNDNNNDDNNKHDNDSDDSNDNRHWGFLDGVSPSSALLSREAAAAVRATLHYKPQ